MAEHSRMMNFHSSILQVASIIKNNEQKKSADNFDGEKKKRERQANYTQEETDRLTEVIMPKKDILENKKNGADQWQEKKKAWKEIEREFNEKSITGIYRDSKTLRLKYECLKKDFKKKWNIIMTANPATENKLPKFSALDQKIAQILQMPLEERFCDFSAANDDGDDDYDDDDDGDSGTSERNDGASTWTTEFITKRSNSDDDDDDESMESNHDDTEYETFKMEQPSSKKVCRDPLNDKVIPDNQDMKRKLETNIKLKKNLIQKVIQEKELKIKLIQEKMEQSKILFELQKKHLVMQIEALEKGCSDNNDIFDI